MKRLFLLLIVISLGCKKSDTLPADPSSTVSIPAGSNIEYTVSATVGGIDMVGYLNKYEAKEIKSLFVIPPLKSWNHTFTTTRNDQKLFLETWAANYNSTNASVKARIKVNGEIKKEASGVYVNLTIE